MGMSHLYHVIKENSVSLESVELCSFVRGYHAYCNKDGLLLLLSITGKSLIMHTILALSLCTTRAPAHTVCLVSRIVCGRVHFWRFHCRSYARQEHINSMVLLTQCHSGWCV